MIVLLNGAFGVGKTSVARELRGRLPGSAIFDPEHVGWVLQRLPRWLPVQGLGGGDFQDIPAWRRLSIRGVAGLRRVRSTVIVPMAFSNPAYLQELTAGVARRDPDLHVFCLRASLDTIHARLGRRGHDNGGWARRRAAECVLAHRDPAFGDPVDTEGRSVGEIAADLCARVTAA